MNDHKAIFKFCKELGCCDACCVRYCALRKPTVFTNLKQFIDENFPAEPTSHADEQSNEPTDKPEADALDSSGTPAKKSKLNDICVSCLGILQEESWPECFAMTKEVLDKKKYESSEFACALSAPLATIIREKWLVLQLSDKFPSFDTECVTPLKEAWRWGAGAALGAHLRMTSQSGACAQLHLTLTMEYPFDSQESCVFEPWAARAGGAGGRGGRRGRRAPPCSPPVTRALLDKALDNLSLAALTDLCQWGGGVPAPGARARCVSVEAHHLPVYLGGRYIKLSRALPQSPWVVSGQRVMESSVQEIIFQPIAQLYGWETAEAEGRLKFVSAGREDVDVRCLGDGRPFAVEVSDPRRALSAAELEEVCVRICASGRVRVLRLQHVDKEKLSELKKGEESKHKTYEALCVKLTHTPEDIADGSSADSPVVVHQRDMDRVNACCAPDTTITQRTPLRVLHRRTLLQRTRRLLSSHAHLVPDHPQLFIVRVQTEAGTYVKEWVHGELGRTRPALGAALGARCDILALDVASVHLPWP